MRRMPRQLAALLTAAALGALVVTGCGGDPYAKQREQLRQSKASPDPGIAAARGATEALPPRDPAPAPVAVEPAPKPTPERALGDFAARWSNWSWRDVDRQQQALAAMATGALSAQLAAQARTAPDVVALRDEKPSFRGTVEAVTVKDVPGEPDLRHGVVVVREQSYNDDRPAEGGLHWSVYVADVRQVAGGWAIAKWEGQP